MGPFGRDISKGGKGIMKGVAGLLLLAVLFQIFFILPASPQRETTNILRVQKSFYDVLHYNAVAEERAVVVGLLLTPLLLLKELSTFVYGDLVEAVEKALSERGPEALEELLTAPSIIESLEDAIEEGADVGLATMVMSSQLSYLYDQAFSAVSEGDALMSCGSPTPDDLREALERMESGVIQAVSPSCQGMVEVSILLDKENVKRLASSLTSLEDLDPMEWLRGAVITIRIGGGKSMTYSVKYGPIRRVAVMPPHEIKLEVDDLLEGIARSVYDSYHGPARLEIAHRMEEKFSQESWEDLHPIKSEP